MAIAADKDFHHRATGGIDEPNGSGVHAHKLAFNQRNMHAVGGANMAAQAFFTAQVEEAMTVSSAR